MENQNEHYRQIADTLLKRGFQVELDTESKTGRIRTVKVLSSGPETYEKVVKLQDEFPDSIVWYSSNTQKIYLRLRGYVLANAL